MAKALAIIEASIAKLVGIEKESKALVAELAVDCLDHLHENGQAAVCNKMLLALSPANKRVVYAFFKTFSGFHMDKEEGMKKKIQRQVKDEKTIKDVYKDCELSFRDFKEQGSNLWLWYAAWGKKEAPEAKPLDLNKVAKTVQGFVEKAEKEGIARLAVFNAIVGTAFEAKEVADMLAELARAPKVGE